MTRRMNFIETLLNWVCSGLRLATNPEIFEEEDPLVTESIPDSDSETCLTPSFAEGQESFMNQLRLLVDHVPDTDGINFNQPSPPASVLLLEATELSNAIRQLNSLR